LIAKRRSKEKQRREAKRRSKEEKQVRRRERVREERWESQSSIDG